MDELIRQYPVKIFSLAAIIIGGVVGALYKMGWLRVRKYAEWDGQERRRSEPCDLHSEMHGKVCALYQKMEQIDFKLDSVSEKLQFLLGSMEARWGKRNI